MRIYLKIKIRLNLIHLLDHLKYHNTPKKQYLKLRLLRKLLKIWKLHKSNRKKLKSKKKKIKNNNMNIQWINQLLLKKDQDSSIQKKVLIKVNPKKKNKRKKSLTRKLKKILKLTKKFNSQVQQLQTIVST